MDSLKKLRAAVKRKTTRITDALLNLQQQNECDVFVLSTYSEQVNELWKELNDVDSQIVVACDVDGGDSETHEADYNEIAGCIDKLKFAIARRLSDANNSVVEVQAQLNLQQANVRLPNLELPTFSGNYLDWISFRDLFKASIHEHHSLSNAQKLQYLKLSLKGDAAILLHSMQISDANYERAWKILSDRYENETEIIYATLDTLFSQTNLVQESACGLHKLLDTTVQCLDTLEILKQPVNKWDTLLVYFLRKKLDTDTLRQWRLTHTKGKLRTFEEFRNFLEQRACALSLLESSTSPSRLPDKSKAAKGDHTARQFRQTFGSHIVTSLDCIYCKAQHSIYKCDKFVPLTKAKKWHFARKTRLCTNCLGYGHFRSTCTSLNCKFCDGRHLTISHSNYSKRDANKSSPHTAPVSNCFSETESNKPELILLPTAVVLTDDFQGKDQMCRVLIDCGSQSSFITEHCVQRLGLTTRKSRLRVNTISNKRSTTSDGLTYVKLSSRFDKADEIVAEMHTLPQITCSLPQHPIDVKKMNCFSFLRLADPGFANPNKNDMLLGADVCPKIFLDGQLKSSQEKAMAMETIFGWVILGQAELNRNMENTTVVQHSTFNSRSGYFKPLPEQYVLRQRNIRKYAENPHICRSTQSTQDGGTMFQDVHDTVCPLNNNSYILKPTGFQGGQYVGFCK